MDLKTSLMNLQCEMVAERALVNPRNISWLQYDILFQLQKENGSVPSHLSVVLGTSRVKLSKALKGLKSSGYIHQTPSQSDGRELRTSLTDEGKKLLNGIAAEHIALYRTALAALTEDEQKEFARLADKLSSALKKKRVAHHR